MAAETYDAIVIGTGQAGKPLAASLGRAGLRTAIIERGPVGGTCVNIGCSPTKTMVASAKAAWFSREGSRFGVENGTTNVNMAQVRQRKQAIVDAFSEGGRKGLERIDKVELIFGTARFKSASVIDVDLNDGGTRELSASRIFINSGLSPRIPELPGLQSVPYLTSTSIMELDRIPEHLVILGGGYVGLEFGQMFRRFGSQVTILQRSSQLLPAEDPDVAEMVKKILEEDGISVALNATVTSVVSPDSRRIRVSYEIEGVPSTVEGNDLLVAVGRVPSTEELHLELAGIEVDERGFINVNHRLETTAEGVFALGDVKGGPAFTQVSYDDFRIVRANVLDGDQLTIENRLIPYTVFIDPQLGHIGMHEKETRSSGRAARIATMKLSHVAMALEKGESRGLMKVIVDSESDQILGFSVLGVEGGELMSVVQIAMMAGLPYTALRDAVFTHPSMAESLNNLFARLDSLSPKQT